MREDGFMSEPGGAQPAQAPHHRARADALRDRRRSATIEPLLTLLRRYAAEAAREEARHVLR